MVEPLRLRTKSRVATTKGYFSIHNQIGQIVIFFLWGIIIIIIIMLPFH